MTKDDTMARMGGFAAVLGLSGLLLLGGCVSATQYAAVSEALKGSPSLRNDEIDRCVKTNRSTAREKDIMRKLMNLSPGSDTARVGCTRMVGAVASGRLSYADYQSVRMGQVTPQLIRVLQAR